MGQRRKLLDVRELIDIGIHFHQMVIGKECIKVSRSDAHRPEESRRFGTFCQVLYTFTPREAPGATPANRR